MIIKIGMYHAQNQPKLKLKEKGYWKEASELFDVGDYHGAMGYFEDLYQKYPNWGELNYKMGVSLYHYSNHKLDGKKYFKKATQLGVVEAHYYMGKMMHLEHKFDEAIEYFQTYLGLPGNKEISNEEIKRLQDISARAKNLLKISKDLIIENLGQTINSKYPDYVPLITSDESMLIFTSRREGSTGNKLDPYQRYFEDIYISYNNKGNWTVPVSIGDNINDETHNACVGLSPEGNILIIFKTDKTLLAGDLYWSEFNGENWSDPVKYGNNINSDHTESSAAFTPDGRTLYFSSDRPEGLGGKDIYRVNMLPNGEWSLPQNLGPTINTPYDDDAPFIQEDGKTMYFSSQGHNTIGEYDIFKSYLDENGNWSIPENVGSPINTVDDDIFFNVSASGKTAYFSSERPGGFGEQDIYEVDLNSEGYPVLKGKILSASDTTAHVKATIALEDATNGKLYGIYKNNVGSGNYILLFNYGRKYSISIRAEGYKTLEKEFIISESKEGDHIENFYLEKVKE